MTNKEIREEMMIQIEQLKTIEILNRLGMHNKDCLLYTSNRQQNY